MATLSPEDLKNRIAMPVIVSLDVENGAVGARDLAFRKGRWEHLNILYC